VRVVQRGGHARLLLEPAPRVRVEQLLGEEFDRDGAVEIRIGAAADDTHAAPGDQPVDTVEPEQRAHADAGRRARHGGRLGGRQARLHGAAQVRVTRGALSDERESIGRRPPQRFAVQMLGLLFPIDGRSAAAPGAQLPSVVTPLTRRTPGSSLR
jgi:hypothetical protein